MAPCGLPHACSLRPAAMTRSGELIPALAGSALKDQGVEALLDALVDFLPPPEGDADAPLCGVVFGVEMDKTMGRAALTRMFSGPLVQSRHDRR